MHAPCARHCNRGLDGVHVQIARRGRRRTDAHGLGRGRDVWRFGIGRGVNGDRFYIVQLGRADYPERNFAAIRD